ncbi:23S rRNA (adenine(2503)-C(2))-methyltransferase RlmN [bacterium]|nr:23S rRNA (adenine(2503)-C(2))-methyltransferase RlmN [bacterium]
METKPLIYDLNFEEIQALVKTWGQPAYRATQIWEGLYGQFVTSPEDFPNLPKALREKLADNYSFSGLQQAAEMHSSDGETTKLLFELADGEHIETVLMKYKKRNTLCISSQAGCAMNCSFCATGQMGFFRNLTPGEIVEQVLFFARQLKENDAVVTNIVLMGMGEPFHNYDAVMKAINIMNHENGMKLGARRFTISTVGLIPGIKRFTEERSQVNLAISLHATSNTLRDSMMPVNKRYPIEDLIQACRDYFEVTRRRVTFEWALIQNVNDSVEEAQTLANLLQGLICHVNVIPLNPTQGFAGEKSDMHRVLAFQQTLEKNGIPCTVRIRRGIDIQAGCGQLATKHRK